jgi:hypothetical protein
VIRCASFPTIPHRHRCRREVVDLPKKMTYRSISDKSLIHWSGRSDSNTRPLAPHASTLPGCATPRRGANYSRGSSGASTALCRHLYLPCTCRMLNARSTGIAQARRNAVDRQVNPALHPFFDRSPCLGVGPVPLDQFNLQVVQRVQIREPVLDRTRQ